MCGLWAAVGSLSGWFMRRSGRPSSPVLAEMLSSKPLFPGRDYHHQLTLILDVLGSPSLEDFYAISSTRSRDYLRALPFKKKVPFSTLYPNANPEALDLLEK